MKPGDEWYFAYGSNLSVDQKEMRTGRIRKATKCRLPGHRLAFNKEGRHGEVYANIMPDAKSEVWGVAYLCNPEAMNELDRFEGVPGGHYHREKVEVVTETGEKLSAVAYVAGPRPVTEEGWPSKDYLERILKGAAHHGLPAEYIREIEQRAAGKPSGTTPCVQATGDMDE